jgi:hypothetical protein
MGTINVLNFLPRLCHDFPFSVLRRPSILCYKMAVLSDGCLGLSRGLRLFTPPTAGIFLEIAQHAPGRRGSIDIGVKIKDTTTCHSG